jgi:hypothetical protein
LRFIKLHIVFTSLFALLLGYEGICQKPYNLHSLSSDTLIDEKIPYDENKPFFDSLKNKVSQYKWANELHNIIVLPSRKEDTDPTGSERLILDYLPYEGMIIRNIDFERLPPFGTNIYDTSWVVRNSLTNFGNTIHIKTLLRVLERNLIIKPGDKLDLYKIADNERLFRELKYIEDVRFLIKKDSLDPGYVDLVILTKDLWSKAFFLELKELDEGRLGLWDRNIFGTGNDFENNIHWNPNKSDFFGYDAIYKNRNIYGTFINSSIYYRNIFETESYGFELYRRFFTPSTKYAGGLSASKTLTEQTIWYNANSNIREPLSFSIIDGWFGRSFSLKSSMKNNARRLNLILASRILKNNYTIRPLATSENFFHQYHNNTIWLNSISLNSQSYYRSNLIYSFGRTEDIPNGWLANFTLGKEFSEFEDRIYTSGKFAYGDFTRNIGYTYAEISAGTFINNGGKPEQGVTRFSVNYFTNLFVFGRYKLRHFINLDYTRGVNRFELERININDRNGIRGLKSDEIFGQKRFNLSMESVMFSPASRYGFRFSFFGFTDFALIGEGQERFIEMDNYNGFGFGIRVRNERLVFPTFQFRFAFYPGIGNIDPINYFQFSGEKKLNPENFSSGSPELIKFQ